LKCKSFGSLLAASWKQFTLIIMNQETCESRNFQVDTYDELVHIIFVTKCSTRLHHWTEDSTILITVVLYVRSQFCHIFVFFNCNIWICCMCSFLVFFFPCLRQPLRNCPQFLSLPVGCYIPKFWLMKSRVK
jgi:hypothetical protein